MTRTPCAVLLVVACDGGSLPIPDSGNAAPTVQILEPLDGDTFAVDEPFSLLAAAGDDATALEDLALSLTSDRLDNELVPDVTVVEGDTGTVLSLALPHGLQDEGVHWLTLAVRDDRGEAAGDDVKISIAANQPPTVTFLSPLAEDVFGVDDVIAVTASIEDAQTIASLTWGGDAAGLGPPLPAAGLASLDLGPLGTKGTYFVSLDAVDALGAVGSAQIEIHVAQEDNDLDTYDVDIDCNDWNDVVFPGADELCNGFDDDCDDVVDEPDALDAVVWHVDVDQDGLGDPDKEETACFQRTGLVLNEDDCDDDDASVGAAPTWYVDADEDGFGDAETEVAACEAPEDHVADATDCNDDVAEINPSVDEACDLVDNDCDGRKDEGAAVGAYYWYLDADGDGLGSGDAIFACGAPSSKYVLVSGDCDDSDSEATVPLVWYVDEDKDGLGTDEFVEDCEAPGKKFSSETGDCNDGDAAIGLAPTWYLDADGDGHGVDTYTDVGCAPAAGFVATNDDCDDLDGENRPSGTESCDGGDNDCDTLVDEAGATGELTWYADTDGDGFGDPNAQISACSAPLGHVSDDTDCDDDDAPEVHPGADEYCNGIDDDCNFYSDEVVWAVDKKPWWEDLDGDGWGDPGTEALDCYPEAEAENAAVYVAGDCDDTPDRADVHPEAPELCDHRDNDCDGGVDEDPTNPSTWTLDRDGDGQGDETPGTPTHVSCWVPDGFSGMATDCDDWDPVTYEDAEELCDEVDNDCDGEVDDPTGPPLTWYRDEDDDTFGNPDFTEEACARPGGFVADATDCDDAHTDVNPDGSEVCNNGLDDDCDGTANDCFLSGTYAANTMDVRINGSDMFGNTVRAGDITGDGVADIVVGTPRYPDRLGAVTIHAGGSSISHQTMSTGWALLKGAEWADEMGGLLDLCDVDGDEQLDLVVGTGYWGDYAYVLFGPVPKLGEVSIDDAADVWLSGFKDVGCLGDIDGVAGQEIGLGGIDNTGGYHAGGMYVVGGELSGTVDTMTAYKAHIYNTGSQWWGAPNGRLGDFDGDGRDEFWVNGYGAGKIDVFPGGTLGTMAAHTGRLSVLTAATTNQTVIASAAADEDGDGTPDVFLVGAPVDPGTDGDVGRIALLRWPLPNSIALSEAEALWDGLPGTNTGAAIALGDLNGDEYPDVVFGAPRDGTNWEGALYVYYGPFDGGDRVANGTWDVKVVGGGAKENLGNQVALADVNDDGVTDLVIGAFHGDDWNGGLPGRVYVLFGLGL